MPGPCLNKHLAGTVAEFPAAEQRTKVALQVADAYARRKQTPQELAVYNRLRRVLGTELGTDPGRELQLIHRAVLRQDDAAVAATRLGHLSLAA